MSHANKTTENARIWRAQIDKATWLDLTRLCERIVDSFGLIGPISELGMEKSDAKRLKSLIAIRDITAEGHAALKAFAVLWARLDEQAYRGGVQFCPRELEELRQEARRSPIPETRPVSRAAQLVNCPQALSLEVQAETDGREDDLLPEN